MERTEREKMLAGDLYLASDPHLVAERLHARRLLQRYNTAAADDVGLREALLGDLFARVGAQAWVEPPFFCDYGWNIHAGDRLYLNFNCVILDPAPVTFGDDVFLGPGVHLYTATHPVDPEERATGLELARPVTIGSRVWIGGGSIVLPGVTIGEGTTVGAGSVVTKDLPPRVIAAGNPARVLRPLPPSPAGKG